MRILVTGATGFIGRALIDRLLRRGDAVTALSRDARRAASVLPVRCACVQWDPATPLAAALLRGIDVVVHLAGEGVADRRWSPARKQAILRSRADSSRALVDAMAALPADARPRTLIAASAIGYYGDRGDEQLDEQSPPGSGFLAEVCRAWEDEVRRAGDAGVRTVSIRIGIVLGRHGGALARMLPAFRLGLGGPLGSGRQWMSWIHLHDLVALFEYVVERDAVRGVFNGVAPQPVTNREFTAALARTLRRPAMFAVPAPVLRLGLGELSSALLGSQRVLPRAAERAGFRFAHPQLAGALADICGEPDHEFVSEQWVPRGPAEVFDFFAEAGNLERITPPFVHFRVLRASAPRLHEGTRIDYRLRLHGVPVRWQSEIAAWQPPRSFRDVQRRGPYRRWQHEHQFEPFNGGTIIRDRVHYALPLGALGDLVAGWLVARDVREIFAFRRRVIEQMFGSAAAPPLSHPSR